ncbi:Glutathione S-transferase 3 [Cladobotryum mycophilum]|uniref:Glutathione S-transferase 3 n=1 Tax=Cladobotryum mycophilum TaxID=491253 RepID=A0ABR0SUN6_9HYPO
MSLTLEVPSQYGLVLAVATSTFFLNTIHFFRTAKFRKISGVGYPNAYASTELADKNPAAHKFNCAQRAHANFTENHTPFLGALLISGLRFPVAAAVVGAAWAVSRVLFVLGYTSDAGPKGRRVGSAGSFITDTILKGLAVYTSYVLVTGQ